MSVSIAKSQAALKKEEGKLKKFLKSLKKLVSVEFVWMVFILILAIPLTVVLSYVVNKYAMEVPEIQTAIESVLNDRPVWYGCYLLNVSGIYFARTIYGAIIQLTGSKKSE